MVAIDQRNTLKRMYAAVGQPDATDAELVAFKADVLGALDNASAVLIDPSYGVPALARLDAGRRSTGVLIAAEPSDRGTLRRRAPGHPRPRAGRGAGCGPAAGTR